MAKNPNNALSALPSKCQMKGKQGTAHLRANQHGGVSMEDRGVVTGQPMSLLQRLARFSPARHGGEVMLSYL